MALSADELAAAELKALARIVEFRHDPIKGALDFDHLKAIHRRIFQDTAEFGPGLVRPDNPSHVKLRGLEQSRIKYTVHYDRASNIKPRIREALANFSEVMNQEPRAFAKNMAGLYARLDFAHAFSEGNSRTLRLFTAQLAARHGFNLDWAASSADAADRDRLYLARDMAVAKLALEQLPGHTTERAMVAVSSAARGSPDLEKLIAAWTVRPPGIVATLLKGGAASSTKKSPGPGEKS